MTDREAIKQFLAAFDESDWQGSYLMSETLDAIAQLRAQVEDMSKSRA